MDESRIVSAFQAGLAAGIGLYVVFDLAPVIAFAPAPPSRGPERRRQPGLEDPRRRSPSRPEHPGDRAPM